MNLTKESRYSEIKGYFEKQIEDNALPKTLNSRSRYYRAVTETVKLYIAQIDNEIVDKKQKLGRALKEKDLSHPALAAKANLLKLYEDLQNKAEWNKTLAEANEGILNKGLH
jgi:hypothetical protein